MTRNDVNSPDFSTLDAGKLLPGVSVPVAVSELPADRWSHAFQDFEPLPIDGLNKAALASVSDSITDVARSLQNFHQAGECYGRITSTSFHNRGTASQPAATLWIDPKRAAETDVVHSGDPESMYWTDARLQSDANATAADDWYALGIVIAEISLSSTAVHKIWELSRQDGAFVDNLVKNLKRSRRAQPLSKIAIKLIRESASGKVSSSTLSQLTTRVKPGKWAITLSLATSAFMLVMLGSNVYQRSLETKKNSEVYEGLETRVDELRQLIGELQSKPKQPEPVVVAVKSPPTVARFTDRDRWGAEIAGRSLQEAVDASAAFDPPEWHQTLIAIQNTPGQKQWRTTDPGLRQLIQQAIDKPWDESIVQKATERLDALNQAHAKWSAWARSSRSIEAVRTQHELMRPGLVKEFLGQWLGEAFDVDTFDLRTRVVRSGEDNEFLAHVVGFETSSESKSTAWEWGSTDGKDDSIEQQVENYRAGEALSFWLKQDSSIPYWDSTVIRHEFDSPLLVWQLAKGLRLENSRSGYCVLLTTNKRFGPPAKLQTSSQQTMDATVKRAETANRKVVDPIDELPFGLD